MSADQIVGVGGGRWAEHRVEGSLCLCLHPLSPTLLLVQFSVIRLVKYSTEWPLPLPLPPYPPLFPILPSQQTPISSDPWMFGPYFLLFRSFQFQFLGFFHFPFTMFYQGKLQEHTKISRSVCAVVGKILRLNMIKQNSITGLFARKETLGTLSFGSLFKQKLSLR